MTHRFVLAGIALHLGTIQGHMAQAHHPSLLAQPQDLHEQIAQRIEVAAPEFTDPTVVRLLVAGQHPECQVLVAGPLDPAGGDDAHAVAVEQQQRQSLRGRLRLHPGVKPLLPTGILALGRDQNRGEIQLIYQIQQEIHLVVIREPVTG
jgi:hypothetical protein